MAGRSAARRKPEPATGAGRPTVDLPCLRGEITVVGFLNPLKPHESIATYMPGGSSLADIIGDAHERVWIQVDGVDVPRIQWGEVRPAAWNLVTVHQQPGKSGKGLLGIIAGIGLGAITGGLGFAISAGLSASLTFTTGGLIAAAAAGAVIGGLQGIVGALFAPQQPKTPNQTQITQRPSWSGVSNQITLYGPVPQPFGKYISYPIIVGKPFTEVIGDDQYLRCLFCTGIGSFHLSDWKIGDTALDQFDGVEVVVSGAYTTFDDDYGGRVSAGDVFDLYGQTVDEQFLTIGLTYKEGDDGSDPVPSATRTTETGTTRISMDLTCPTGLMSIQKKTGDPRSGIITFRVEYKAHADDTWTNLNTRADAKLTGPNFVVEDDHYSVTAAQPSTLRLGLDWTVDADQYDVRVTYLDYTKPPDTTGKSEVEPTFQWTALRSWKPGRPVNQVMVDKTTLVAVKIKATNQTQTLDKVNMIAETKLRVWDSETGTWSDPQITRNPAWAAVEVLTGIGNASPANDNQLNLDDFAAFAEDCASLGIEFNDPGLDQVAVLARLRMILNGALAEWRFDDTGLGVIRDTADETPTQMLTPANSWDFKSTKTFLDLPHAFKVPFADPDNGWQIDYAILYTDGYSEDGSGDTAVATQMITLDYRGSTSHDQSYKYAVFHEAQLRLRPEVYEATMDAESVVCRRGDVISATHDIAMWGLGYGQILEVTTNEDGDATAVRVDEPLKADGGAISVRIRRFDGTLVIQALDDLEAGSYTTLPFADPVSGLEGGELISYGGEALLKVASIKPKGKLQATLTFVDAAPEIRTAVATGTIPDYDPQVRPRVQTPPQPRLLSVQADDLVAHINADGTVARRVVVSFDYAAGLFVPVAVEGQIRRTDQDANAPFGPTQRNPLPPAQIAFPVSGQAGATFEWRIRTVASDGTPSPWLTGTATLAGDAFEPDPVTGLALTASEDGRSVTATWDAADFARYAYTEIQRDTADTFATAVTAGTPSSAPWVDTVAPGDTYWYRARHVSTTIDADGQPIVGDWCDAISVVAPAAVAYLLDKLSGELTETQLAEDLASRIDLIDASAEVAGSVAARVAAEAAARAAAVSAVASDLAQEVTDRGTAVAAEATARANAVSSEATTRSNADSALSDRLDTVEASASGNSAAIASEASTRASADGALSDRIDAVVATAGDNTAAISTEATARADADSAMASQIDVLQTGMAHLFADSFGAEEVRWTQATDVTPHGEIALAAVTDAFVGGNVLRLGNNSGNDTVWALADTFIPFDPNKLYKLRVDVRRTEGTGTFYAGWCGYAADKTTRVSVAGANSTANGHYHAAAGNAPNATWSEFVGYTKGFAAASGDTTRHGDPTTPGKVHPDVRYLRPLIIANYTGVAGTVEVGQVVVEVGDADANAANISTHETRLDTIDGQITSISSDISSLQADVGANAAAISSEAATRASADGALSDRIDAVEATSGDNTAAIAAETTARTDADTALASDITTLKASTSQSFIETWENGFADWASSAGQGEMSIVTVDDGLAGGSALRIGNNSGNDDRNLEHARYIPYDPTKLYKLTGSVRRVGTTTGKAYIGIRWYDADKVLRANHYPAVSSLSPTEDFVRYAGYFSGTGATTVNNAHDPLNPSPIPSTYKYFRFYIIGNYNGVAGIMDFGPVELSVGAADANASAISAQGARLDTAEGNISAQASDIEALQADVAGNTAAITDEATARADGDSSAVSQATTLAATAQANALAKDNPWTKTYTVHTGVSQKLQNADGTSPLSNGASGWHPRYSIEAVTTGTGTITGVLADLVWNGSTWTLTIISAAGVTSNNPKIFLDDDGDPAVTLWNHTSNYSVSVTIRRYAAGNTSWEANNSAAISAEQTARADAVSAVASDVETLQTTVGGHTTSISEMATSIDGIQAEYAVKIDVSGRVSGFGLIGSETETDFIILADKFAIADPDAPDTYVFAVDNGKVLLDLSTIAGLPAANIGANELHATTLVETTTTRTLAITTQTGHTLTVPDPTSWTDIETVTVTVASANDDVTVEFNLRMNVSNYYLAQFYDEHWYNDVLRFRIVRDGSVVIRDESLNQLVHSDAATGNTKQVVSNGTIPVASIVEYITGLSPGTHTFLLQAAGIDMTDQVTTSTLAASVTYSFAKGEVLHATGG